MKDMRTAHDILFGKSEGKKLLGRHEHGQKYDIKVYLKEVKIEWKDVEWICLAHVGDI